jgi:sec-independent protein translocase protein TatA
MAVAVAGPFGLGAPELIIILVVVMLIFGVGKLADIGGALGKSIREFRRAAREPEEPESPPSESDPAATSEPR